MNDLRYTLIFLTRGNDILMLKRRKAPNRGLWNGIGGHLEDGETALECALREVREETGFAVERLRFGGMLTWEGFEIEAGGLYIFSGEAPEGEPEQTTEGLLAWKPREWVFSSPDVVSNIHVFGPRVMAGDRPLRYHFTYRDGRILENAVFPLEREVLLNGIQIRSIHRNELAQVEAAFPEGGVEKHGERLSRQGREMVDYLVAWDGDQPVGHALLNWQGSGDEPMRSRLEGTCPDVEDLFVRPDLRGMGLGTRILAEAERRTAERGYRQLGLGVDVTENPGARRLYERLGYLDAGFGEYTEGGEYLDSQGVQQHWEEVCVYLIKVLRQEST